MKKNLINFSSANPQLKVVASVVPNRHPILIGEYSNAHLRYLNVQRMAFPDKSA